MLGYQNLMANFVENFDDWQATCFYLMIAFDGYRNLFDDVSFKIK
jgi:hypothetical protein